MCVPELRATSQMTVHNFLTTQTSQIDQLVNIEQFRTLQRLYRMTDCVLKFLRLTMKKAPSTRLTPPNMTEAKLLLITSA